jgi:hypothetical protein
LKFGLFAASVAILAMAGCREAEQQRPLTYEPGVFKGEKGQPLGEERLDQLRQRGQQQRFY